MLDAAVHPRAGNAVATLALARRGVRSIVVPFALTGHGTGDYAFVSTLVGVAREKGVSAYVGDGANRWPAVHLHVRASCGNHDHGVGPQSSGRLSVGVMDQ
jgi:hypothetical protein